jgi:hypothetical protein
VSAGLVMEMLAGSNWLKIGSSGRFCYDCYKQCVFRIREFLVSLNNDYSVNITYPDSICLLVCNAK